MLHNTTTAGTAVTRAMVPDVWSHATWLGASAPASLETLQLPLVATSFKGFKLHAIIFTRAHLPVQYAAPWEKNTEMSDPISPDHSSSSAFVAGRSVSRLAAHSAVAALPLPPPRPAPVSCGHCDRLDEDEGAE